MMMSKQYDFDWNELAFASKKPLKELKTHFIVAPRELSESRFKQLIKEYLSSGNILLGLAKEEYILGFEDQPQFKTLHVSSVQKLIDSVNKSASPHKIYTLHYFQRELEPILEKIPFKQVLLVNGSWKYALHNLPIYYQLVNKRIPFKLISPFTDEVEARSYGERMVGILAKKLPTQKQNSSEAGLLGIVEEVSKQSFDYNFQTGAALAKQFGKRFSILAVAHNKVVPFETYALHNGASREVNFSPPHDLNHYDTVHAEVELILIAAKKGINLDGASLFINLLPCPPCARMLADSSISEVVYQNDHSDGYAVKLLEMAGKKVRRVVI